MTTLNMEFPDGHSTKEQEKEFLRTLAVNSTPGSYVCWLFTSEMVEWCCEMIGSDNSPDLFGHFVSARKDLVLVERDLSDAKKELHLAGVELAECLRVKENLLAQLRDAQEKIASDSNNFNNLNQLLEESQMEILKLKAKLYDMISGGEG